MSFDELQQEQVEAEASSEETGEVEGNGAPEAAASENQPQAGAAEDGAPEAEETATDELGDAPAAEQDEEAAAE